MTAASGGLVVNAQGDIAMDSQSDVAIQAQGEMNLDPIGNFSLRANGEWLLRNSGNDITFGHPNATIDIVGTPASTTVAANAAPTAIAPHPACA